MSRILVPQLFTSQISDQYSRDNFRKITDFFNTLSLFSNFRFLTAQFDTANPHQKVSHNLGFIPKDAILTSATGTGTVTFNYSLFDIDNLDLNVTGPCVVRLLIGSFD